MNQYRSNSVITKSPEPNISVDWNNNNSVEENIGICGRVTYEMVMG
jgi:hypothetical protein